MTAHQQNRKGLPGALLDPTIADAVAAIGWLESRRSSAQGQCIGFQIVMGRSQACAANRNAAGLPVLVSA
jgi:hypothetical protein